MIEPKYEIVPHYVHKEKGIKNICNRIDKMLKEVYKDYKLLDRCYNKKFRILELSDRIVYSTDYPSCNTLNGVSIHCRYIVRTAVMGSCIIFPDSCDRDVYAVWCASRRITTNMRRITALLLWLRKYGTIDDWYTSKNNKAAITISKLYTVGNNTILVSTCDITVNFYKGNKFDKRISYSKKGRCSVIGKEIILM